MKILGISISEFHDKAGFQLVECVPHNTVLTKQQFTLYSDLILPREELCDRILAIEFKQDYFLVVKPLLSKNKNNQQIYKREKYIYSVSILVAKADYLDKVKQPLYKHIVAKVAHFLKIIEETNNIIHYHQKYTAYIIDLLTNIYQDINQKGSCDLTYLCNYFTFINVNHPPNIQPRCNILQSSVPVTTLTQNQIEKIQSVFAQKLLAYAFQGTYSFKKICRLNPDRKEAEIKQFYFKAMQRGVVFILDMLNIHNVYTLTSKILQFLPQHESKKYEVLGKIGKVVSKNKGEEISKQDMLCLYLQFNRVSPLYKVIQSNRKIVSKIDMFKLIRMGQIHGILKRIHQKIAYTQLPPNLIQTEYLKNYLSQVEKSRIVIPAKYLEEQSDKMNELIKKYLSSNMTVDEMMVNLQIDYQRLMNLLTSQNRYVLQINDQS